MRTVKWLVVWAVFAVALPLYLPATFIACVCEEVADWLSDWSLR